jgi:Domain of unknown function (DUF4136)
MMDGGIQIMKTMTIFLLCVFMLTGSIAIADHIRADYDRSAPFYDYKTFMWIKEPQLANAWENEWIVNAVNHELQARGLCLVKSNADLAVSATTAKCNPCSNLPSKAFYAPLAGGWSWYQYWSPAEESITVVETFEADALVINVADVRAERVVWWGAATEAVSDSVKHINKRIEQMFLSFPPWA